MKIGFRDGLKALWLVFRFNLFCSLRSSFHRIPDLRTEHERNIEEFP